MNEDVRQAAALVKQERWVEAIAAWRACFDVYSSSSLPWWYSSLGLSFRKAGRAPEAEAIYRRALLEYPADAAGWIGLAELSAEEQNWPAAVTYWEECLRRSEATAYPWWYAACAQALRKVGRVSEARTLLQRATERWPDDPNAWVGLADLASADHHWQEAIDAWSVCLARYDAIAHCWWYGSLCVALRKTGQWDEAERCFATAIKRWPLEGLHLYLDALFHDRRLQRLARILHLKDQPETPLLQHHRRRLALYEGAAPTDLPSLVDLKAASYPAYLLAQMQDVAAEGAIRLKDIAYVDALSSWSHLNVQTSTYIGIIRFYVSQGEIAKARALLESRLDSASPSHEIMFLEMARDLTQRATATLSAQAGPRDWRHAAALYLDSIPVLANRKILHECLITPLIAIPPGEQDYMDIRFDTDRRKALVTRLLDSLQRERPLGLIRLADGESYGFEHPYDTKEIEGRFVEDDNFREAHWWAKHPSPEQRRAIRGDFERAVLDADILGIPSIYKLARAFETDAANLFLGMPFRSFYKIMQSIQRIGLVKPGHVLFTEERCHHLVLTPPIIDELIDTAPRVTVVSCWTAEQLQLKRSTGVTFILIPPHTKVAGQSRYIGEKALFECYKEIIQQIDCACGSFCLVLVAAGLIGKIFVARARENGCVGLDAGAMLDYYAGFTTRHVSEIV